MKISKVSIKGFKNIESVNIQLSHITAILGINNFGKTNLLKAIDFASKFITAQPNERIELMSDESNIPININNKWENFSFLFVADIGDEQFEYSFSFSWSVNNKTGKILTEDLKVRNKTSGRFIKYINRTPTEMLYRASVDGRCQRAIKSLSDTTLVIEYLTQMHNDIFYIDIINKIANFKVDYNRLTDSRINQDKSLSEISINDTNLSVPENNNILSVLRDLHNNYPDKYEIWENIVKSLVPNIEEIKFNVQKKQLPVGGVHIPNNSVVEKFSMYVKQKNLADFVDFFRLSTGIRRIFLLILSIVLSSINNVSIIEFEELESSICPLMLQKLLITISSLCDNCRIIITSHSPTLINFMNLQSVYIGAANKNDLAYFYRIKKSKVDNLISSADDMGIGIGDFIFGMIINNNINYNYKLLDWIDKDEQLH